MGYLPTRLITIVSSKIQQLFSHQEQPVHGVLGGLQPSGGFEADELPGALVKMPGCPSGGGTLVYFACEDCAVEAARAAAHGGQVVKPKMSIGEHGAIALVQDTEGNMIGLHSMT